MKMLLKLGSMLCLLCSGASAATILYSAAKIGRLGFTPAAMNDDGWIVGTGVDGSRRIPFRYRPGIGIEVLSESSGMLSDINNEGTAVGARVVSFGATIQHAYSRPAGQPWTDLGTLSSPSNRAAEALAINDSGLIVGRALLPFNGPEHAFLYNEVDGMKDLGTLGGVRSRAIDVNEAGQVLGYAQNSTGAERAFLYDSATGMIDLNSLIGDAAFRPAGIADNGMIVGTAGQSFSTRYFAAYSPTIGYRKIGIKRTTFLSVADTNDRGWTVGTVGLVARDLEPFLYVYGSGIQYLNDIVSGLDVRLSTAYAINDRDQILAFGGGHYYLLSRIPGTAFASVATPEPGSLAMLAVGVGLIALARRQRRPKSR